MGVWAVSLSTHQLSPTSLTTGIKVQVFGVCLDTRSCPPIIHSVLYPLCYNQRYTLIYFGENQLSPGSFGILPLTSSHLNPLLRIRVRSSSRYYSRLNLLKVSSPGFGFSDCYYGSPVRARFHFVFPTSLVKLCSNHKLTGSFFNRHDITPINWSSVCLLANNFSSISSPSRGAFHLSLTVLVHYR